ncbi:MAG: TraV family lipoprotein [Pseudomonadota bacterium]|nr:TraV family lipoprotein [Nevskiales bacterium]MEC9358646.1 TraV family lipoprotein [Pseudomonadota bacterium]
MNGYRRLVPMTLAILLSACAGPRYACPIPDGSGGCRSLAQVYREAQALSGNPTPSAASAGETSDSDDARAPLFMPSGTPALETPGPGTALLTTPRVLRVLITPWPDTDGDVHAGQHLYLRLDAGRWTLPQ